MWTRSKNLVRTAVRNNFLRDALGVHVKRKTASSYL